MTIVSVVQQLVQQLQFITLLQQLNINWPAPWLNLTGYFSFFNLDITYFLGQQDIPVIDFRSLFILIAIVVPIALNMVLLLVFQPFAIVLWYLCLCSGAVLLVAGFFAQVLNFGASSSVLFMIIGGALLGVALLAVLVVFIVRKCSNDTRDELIKFEEERQSELRFHRKRTLVVLIVVLLFGIVGIICMRLFVLTIPNVDLSILALPAFAIVGFVCFGIAGVALIILLLSLCAPGRKAMATIKNLLKKNLLMVMLLLLSLSYIPVITYSVNQYLCAPYQCPPGYAFNPYAQRNLNDYDTSPTRYCDPCQPVLQCSLNKSAATLCPGFQGSRAWKHPEVACDTSTIFFVISASIVLVCYIGGMPMLYYFVIQYLTSHIPEKAEVGDVGDDLSTDDRWLLQMAAIAPVARSLYEPHRFSRRYYLLINMLHRTATTIALSVATAYSAAAAALVLFIHGAACIFMLAFRPYISSPEQYLASGLALGNMANGVFAVVVWQQGQQTVPLWVTGIFIAINVFLPVAAAIIGICLKYRDDSQKQKRLEAALKQSAEAELAMGNRPAARSPTTSPHPEAATEPTEDTAHLVAVPARSPRSQREQTVSPPPAAAAAVRSPSTGRDAPRAPAQPPRSPTTASPTNGEMAATSATLRSGTAHQASSRSVTVHDADATNEPLSDQEQLLTPEERKKLRRKKIRERKKKNDMQTEVMDAESTKVLNIAFSAIGLFFFFAAGIAALGYLRQAPLTFIPGNSVVYSTTDYTLGGYSNWNNFVAHCCCIKQTTVSVSYNISERWICDNGNTVQRGRVSLDGADNSLPLRALCSPTFATTCVPTIASNTLSVHCDIVPTGVSSFALTYMW